MSDKSKIISKRIRRQPHCKKSECIEYGKRDADEKQPDTKSEKENDKENETNGKMDSEDAVDGDTNGKDEPMPNNDEEKMDCKPTDPDDGEPKIEIDEPKETKIKCYKRRLIRSAKIGNVIEKLITKVSEQPVNVSSTQTGPGFHFTSSSRSNDLLYSHQHVSPRKRILREFEKVSLEDRNSTTLKRSRSKSNASSERTAGVNYSTVVTHHTVSIANSSKDDQNRFTNGNQSPNKRSSPTDNSRSDNLTKQSKVSTTSSSSSAASNSQSVSRNETPPQTVSKPLSNYSIISLLGHNNTTSDKYENSNSDDKLDARGSPRSPPPSHSYNHQSLATSTRSSSSYATKKRSPTNSSGGGGSSSLVHSPVNYRNSARSPNNSPSPGLQQHHHRFQHNSLSHPASISSPTSSFHPYLSSARVSPLSSGTLSPPDLYRHRSYRTACSPSTQSNSSVSGLSHSYASLNGSPTAFANRYSPSTYSNSSMKTSPTQSSTSSHTQNLSSAFNVSNLLPQSFDGGGGGGGERGGSSGSNNGNNNDRLSHNYSPKSKSTEWSSPAKNQTIASTQQNSPSSHATNSISATTIPKKTASIRQKYGSLSPNGMMNATITQTTNTEQINKIDARKSLNDSAYEGKTSTKRSRSPTDFIKKHQQHELYEKDLQARYNAEMAMRQQSILSALQPPVANHPFYNMYHNAAAAYLNPLYYHPTAEMLRKTHPAELLHKNIPPHAAWIDPYSASLMHYSAQQQHQQHQHQQQQQQQQSGLISDKNPKSGSEMHAMLMSPYGLSTSSAAALSAAADVEMWKANDKKAPVSPIPSAFRRQPQPYNDCEPISLIKDEQSSGKFLN